MYFPTFFQNPFPGILKMDFGSILQNTRPDKSFIPDNRCWSSYHLFYFQYFCILSSTFWVILIQERPLLKSGFPGFENFPNVIVVFPWPNMWNCNLGGFKGNLLKGIDNKTIRRWGILRLHFLSLSNLVLL